MILHGLDKDDPPSAAKAKAMLEEIHGSWWNVYTGGPRRGTGASGWTPEVVQDFAHQGISAFLLTYVGPQILPAKHIADRHLLTTAQMPWCAKSWTTSGVHPEAPVPQRGPP